MTHTHTCVTDTQIYETRRHQDANADTSKLLLLCNTPFCVCMHTHTHTHTYTHTCCCRDMESGLWVATMGSHTQLCVTPQNTLFNNNEQLTHPDPGWSRPIGCLQSQVSFRRRAINSRALFQEMTYKYKAYYGSSQPYSVTNAHLL